MCSWYWYWRQNLVPSERGKLCISSPILVLNLHIYTCMGIITRLTYLYENAGIIFQADSNVMVLVKDNYFY